MTIRYTCDKCGSVLKIKDELAGTDGKCPKCKTRFVIPQPAPEAEHEAETPSHKSMPKAAPKAPAPAKPLAKEATSGDSIPTTKPAKSPPNGSEKAPSKPAAKATAKPADDDEFDPVSFLMEGPRKKPTFEPESDDDDDPPPRSKSAAHPSRGKAGGRGFSLDDDFDDDEGLDAPPPTRKWGAKGGGPSPAERESVNSRNVAQDLLARSMEESRVRAGEMPEAKPRFDFDFAGMFREFGLKSGGMILGTIVGAYLIYAGMQSMIGTKVHLPPLGYVSGNITYEGQPAAGVKVYVSPVERAIPGANEKKERARDSIGITNLSGDFVAYYLPDTAGARVGPCRIWMESMDPKIVVPPKYGLGSTHVVEIKSGPNEPMKIELKPGRASSP
ncbi:MAG: hypothetical protein U0929_12235 [Planctomycetaceae bacterium]